MIKAAAAHCRHSIAPVSLPDLWLVWQTQSTQDPSVSFPMYRKAPEPTKSTTVRSTNAWPNWDLPFDRS